jgi:hypothetical protein
MGYPMTWKRVVNRNGLADGDYASSPLRHQARVNTDPDPEYLADVAPYLAERVKSYEQAFKSLAGDLRRLEQDVQDEGEICRVISARTGVDDMSIVAAILKEFMNV